MYWGLANSIFALTLQRMSIWKDSQIYSRKKKKGTREEGQGLEIKSLQKQLSRWSGSQPTGWCLGLDTSSKKKKSKNRAFYSQVGAFPYIPSQGQKSRKADCFQIPLNNGYELLRNLAFIESCFCTLTDSDIIAHNLGWQIEVMDQ